jgi:hypothetical protein
MSSGASTPGSSRRALRLFKEEILTPYKVAMIKVEREYEKIAEVSQSMCRCPRLGLARCSC